MTRRSHLSPESLARLALGERPSATDAHHLSACDACSRSLASSRTLTDALHPPAGPVPSRRLLADAVRLSDRLGSSASAPARLLSAWAASGPQDAPAGIRSASPSARQWLFAAGEMEVDVQAFPDGPERVRLLGQVLEADRGVLGLPIHLHQGSRAQMAFTDQHGEFSIGPVARTPLRLIIESDEALHEIALDVTEDGPKE